MAEKVKAGTIEPTGIPVLILKEGTQRTYGRDALRANIMIVRAIAETLRTTYGPKGMDKILVDSLGDVTITNDGATILDKMDVQHPTAKLIVQISKGQDEEVGDGTKTAVIFAGELLRQAEDLLDKNLHPTLIVAGFKKAADEAVKKLYEVAEAFDIEKEDILRKVAATSLTSKAVHGLRDYFAEIAVKAVKAVTEKRGEKWYIDLDSIQIIKKHGGGLKDTRLVEGIVLDKEVVHPGMPRRVENAYIVLLDAPLEVEKPEITAKINITSPEQIKAFLEEEAKLLKEIVDRIYEVAVKRMEVDGVRDAGIVVITQKGIDEVAQHFLAKKKILAVRRVKRSDIEKISKATGARIISNIEDLSPEDLGYAKLVEERKVGEDKMVFIEGCPNPKAVTILIRGGLERLVDEAERSLNDALHAVADAIRDGKIVIGAGASEVELAKYLKEIAPKISTGKEQLAIEAFAKALEGLAMALAENAGLDPIEIIMKLRAAHSKPENKWYGINVFTGEIEDMSKLGVYEPVSVKANAIKAGTEAATIVLRIDDVIAAARKEEEKEEKKKEEEEEEKSF